jgi:hypothetical protein
MGVQEKGQSRNGFEGAARLRLLLSKQIFRKLPVAAATSIAGIRMAADIP